MSYYGIKILSYKKRLDFGAYLRHDSHNQWWVLLANQANLVNHMVQHDIYTSGTLIFQVWIATILKMKNKLQKQNRNLVTNSKPRKFN